MKNFKWELAEEVDPENNILCAVRFDDGSIDIAEIIFGEYHFWYHHKSAVNNIKEWAELDRRWIKDLLIKEIKKHKKL